MGRARPGWDVGIVEVAYRAAVSSPGEWLARVFEVALPLLDLGAGVMAYEFDTSRPRGSWLSTPIGNDPTLVASVVPSYRESPYELNDWIHRRAGAVTILTQVIPMLPREHPELAKYFEVLAATDMFGVNASDPSGRGSYFCALSNTVLTRTNERIRRWEKVAAHLAAAGRLRGRLASRPLAEAVLSPDGRVHHASPEAQQSLDGLKRAARAMDGARLRARRADPEALEPWRALVEGRWSLLDEIESDGRRFLVAHPNAPTALDPRRLTATERVIAGYVAMGHSNKLIAYELGLAVGTVSAHLHAIFTKLGVRRRVQLVERVQLLASGVPVEMADLRVFASGTAAEVPAGLTPAEVAVARLAARGLSNGAIARQRGVSTRTVANQLAQVFTKLGVQSRSELALRL